MDLPFGPLKEELEKLHLSSFAWALSCCRWNREEAEDVLQAAYLEILDGRARFEGRSAFKTWLFSVIRRTASSRRRKNFVRSVLLDRWSTGEAHLQEVSPAPDTLTHEGHRSRKIAEVLSSLSERQRQVLDLVFFHGLTLEEAAKIMEVSLGTARVHYDRGKKELRKRLQAVGINHE